MEKKRIAAPSELYKTGLLRVAMICGVLAALCGIPGVVLLFSPEYSAYLVRKLVIGGITARSAVATWQIINTVITVACLICPAVLSLGLFWAVRGDAAKGFGFLSDSAYLLLKLVKIFGVVLVAAYAGRVAWYVWRNLGYASAWMNLYAMLISEGIMGALAWFLYRGLRLFVEAAGDCGANIAYTLSSGKIDPVPIPGIGERGFLVIGILCLVWAVNQTVTITIVTVYNGAYYSPVLASHPAEYLAGASLVLNGVACILMRFYLRWYNRICEWEKYQARKMK